MNSSNRLHFTMLVAAVLLLSSSLPASAQPKATIDESKGSDLSMEVGQTHLLHVSTNVVRVSVAEPTVADVQVVTQQQLLVTAKAVGYTHLIVWSAAEEPLVIAVSVNRNLDQLRTQFRQLFPGEDIAVSSVGDLVVLSGTVRDLRLPARAAEVAQLHSERLANLITVAGEQQVQLEVRFAEVSRTALRNAGMNFLWSDPARGYVGGLNSSGSTPGQYLRGDIGVPGTGVGGPPPVPAPATGGSFGLMFSTGLSDFPFSAILNILAQEGLAKVLAEPTLVALSGQDADFHAGGEVPILVAAQLGQVSVRYKKFGVQLKFTPTVLGERTMSMKMFVEVSEPDPSAGVTVTGFQVPGFKTRSSETTIRLRDGQSFAIAGMLSDSVRTSISKVPGLGDLPILGSLFRSTAYQRQETELLTVVTARLVEPLEPSDVPILPGEDEYNDPNDFELFLLGKIEPDKIEDFEDRRKQNMQPTEKPAAQGPVQMPAGTTTPPGSAPAPAAASKQEPLREGPIGPVGFIHG